MSSIPSPLHQEGASGRRFGIRANKFVLLLVDPSQGAARGVLGQGKRLQDRGWGAWHRAAGREWAGSICNARGSDHTQVLGRAGAKETTGGSRPLRLALHMKGD